MKRAGLYWWGWDDGKGGMNMQTSYDLAMAKENTDVTGIRACEVMD